MSDHLPVMMSLVVDESLGLTEELTASSLKVFFRNPADDMLTLRVQSEKATRISISLVSISGSRVYENRTRVNHTDTISISMSGLAPGMYFLQIQAGKETVTRRVIKR